MVHDWMHWGWLGAALVATGLVACKGADAASEKAAKQSETPPVKVETVNAIELPMPELLTLTGTLRASQESDVAADASGKVTATMVERGQAVKQGETLAVLDARGAALTATAFAAQSGLAKAQLEQAQKECQRVQSLFKSGAISQAEYDRTTTQCQAGQFSAVAAQAQQASAQKIVGDAVIRAPFSGIVGERLVNVGQYVQPATKVISLYAPDPLRLELTVPESSIANIKPDLPVAFSVSAFGDKTFSGAVKFISPNIRQSTRDLVIEALVPNADLELRPGMFAVAHLTIGERKLPTVPTSAVRKDDSGARVFVVIERRLQERVVSLGGEKDGRIGVSSGVKANEAVVVKPGPELRDGAPVL